MAPVTDAFQTKQVLTHRSAEIPQHRLMTSNDVTEDRNQVYVILCLLSRAIGCRPLGRGESTPIPLQEGHPV